MKCSCGGETLVIETRNVEVLGEPIIRRRRQCERCKARFSTFETSIDLPAMLRLRLARREALKRFKAKMTPEERTAFNKRNELRRQAREEARATGRRVASVYAEWGVS